MLNVIPVTNTIKPIYHLYLYIHSELYNQNIIYLIGDWRLESREGIATKNKHRSDGELRNGDIRCRLEWSRRYLCIWICRCFINLPDHV